MKPKHLAIVIALIALAWSGYWLVARARFIAALDGEEAALPGRAIHLAYARRQLGGFPFRLIATYDKAVVTGAGAGYGWGVRGDKVALIAQPWNRHHVILHAPDAQVALSLDWADGEGRLGGHSATMKAGTLQASLSSVPGRGPKRLSLVASKVAGETTLFGIGPFTAADMELHLRWPKPSAAKDEGLIEPIVLEPALRIADVTLQGRALGALGPRLDSLIIDASLSGPAIPSREAAALAAWRDAGGTLDVPRLVLRWGPLEVTGSGTLALDDALRPLGALALDAQGLDAALATLEASNRIDGKAAELLRITLQLLTERKAEAARTRVPVNIQEGIVSIGPVGIVRVGPAAMMR
ncbi:MAG: DUF2125 domain-containing protein [Pseudomonadota bacterium]